MKFATREQLERAVKRNKTESLSRIKGDIAAALDAGKFSGDAVTANEMAIEVIDAELARRSK
ncbi:MULTISPECIES: hypothetical protein [Protofrankia]|uniref:Anti-sigma-28 factor FlgM C-terminal domain-containing protein n=1 Tax=Protofrankia coriariae TaxID=1562887 RepID=A0ABR5F423_9ACTN|nr:MULTISPECIES: hypothetical protein [Protofrankia]KLL11474.1 hypothetical protein FrCorBMG51_10295 [Protofrankia coriariae]ONH34955.1 hypothetical protein BL254_13415 [Protofrankia sp. BMG5.30]